MTLEGVSKRFPTFYGQAWKAESDASIEVTKLAHVACEFVSPVLRGEEGIQHLMEFVEFLRSIGATVNISCGLHIHVGVLPASGGGALLVCSLGVAGTLNMLDLTKANSGDVEGALIEEAVGSFPELSVISANQLGAGELSYQTLTRTGYPSAGFHDMGGGLLPSKSSTSMERFEVYPFGGRVEAAKHIADNYKRGGAAGYFSFEALGVLKTAVFTLARQIWYGRAADGKGFPGLKNFTALGTTVIDPITGKEFPMCLNAGGTSANAASSAYLVVTGEQDVELQFGLGSPFTLPEPRIGDVTDAKDPNKKIEAYISVLQGFAGLSTPNKHCVRRIANLTQEAGKGMSDEILADAFASFPAGVKPSAIFMSSKQRQSLQRSRTVVLHGEGTTRPNQPKLAPLPTEYEGVPIYVTDAIGDTDAIEVAALPEE